MRQVSRTFRLELSGRWVMKSERNEAKNEEQWDKLLHIHTTGRDDSKADQFRYPYEPTPYSVLQRLANEGLIRKGDTLMIMAAEGQSGLFSVISDEMSHHWRGI